MKYDDENSKSKRIAERKKSYEERKFVMKTPKPQACDFSKLKTKLNSIKEMEEKKEISNVKDEGIEIEIGKVKQISYEEHKKLKEIKDSTLARHKIPKGFLLTSNLQS